MPPRRARIVDERPPLAPSLNADLEDFLAALRVEAGLARNTCAAYRADLHAFFVWAQARGVTRFQTLEAAAIVDYLGERRARGIAEATVARNLVAIRMLARHLVAGGRLERDPTARLSAPVLRRALPRTLTVDEVERLLRAPEGDGWRAQRDRALLEVLYACGARISEAVSLRTDAIEPSMRVLRLFGKGSKMRLVPLGEQGRAALAAWIAGGRSSLVAAARSPAVFVNQRGTALARVSAWRRVKLAALKAGLALDVSPHTLRHSFASHMVEGGADLRSVQEMLGHASIRTTEVYTHLDVDHITSLHRLYHPRA